MACVVCLFTLYVLFYGLSSFRLTPVWLYWHLCCISSLTPPRPYGLSCFDSCLTPPRLHDLFIICFCLTPLLAIWLVLLCLLSSPIAPVAIWLVLFAFAWRLRGYMACVILLYVSPNACVATWLVWFVIFFFDASKAIWHVLFDICFRLRRCGYTAFVVYSAWRLQGYMAFVLCVSPDASVAIRHVLFSPEACTAIWLMLFILPNATVAKWHMILMCCLFPAWRQYGYTAYVVVCAWCQRSFMEFCVVCSA